MVANIPGASEIVATRHFDLRGIELAGLDLQGAQLGGACLDYSSLDGCILRSAYLAYLLQFQCGLLDWRASRPVDHGGHRCAPSAV